jgi:hypothetical protein
MIGHETGRSVLKMQESPQQQARADYQHKSHGNLGDDQAVPQAAPAPSRGAVGDRTRRGQSSLHIEARCGNCRQKTEKDSRAEADNQQECEYTPIEPDLPRPGNPRRRELQKQTLAQEGEEKTGGAASGAYQHALS